MKPTVNSLRLFAFAALSVSTMSGCILVDDDDEPPVSTDKTLSVSWSLSDISGSPVACPPGFDTLQVISDSQNGLPQIQDLFDCATGTGTTDPFPQGDYVVRARITNSNASQVYAESLPYSVSLVSNASVTFPFVSDGGYFLLGWTIGGMPAQTGCAGASATSVSILSTISNSTTGIEDLFDCGTGYNYTSALAQGTYEVSVSALNAQDLAVGVAPLLQSQPILPQNQVTDLGTVDIPLD